MAGKPCQVSMCLTFIRKHVKSLFSAESRRGLHLFVRVGQRQWISLARARGSTARRMNEEEPYCNSFLFLAVPFRSVPPPIGGRELGNDRNSSSRSRERSQSFPTVPASKHKGFRERFRNDARRSRPFPRPFRVVPDFLDHIPPTVRFLEKRAY